jgi:aspartate racemase
MHIGLIGGIGPAATEHYYRLLVRAHVAAARPLDLTIANAEVADLGRNMAATAPDAQAAIFARLVHRLQAAGATAAAVTSVGGHFCAEQLRALSPLPLISIIPALAAEVARRGLRRVGLLGTRVAMQSRIYGGLSAVEVVVPEGADFDATHEAYVAMAQAAACTDRERDVMFSMGRALVQRHGAEVVILAGTDLFLAFEGRDCGFPTLDSAAVHVDALTRTSLA